MDHDVCCCSLGQIFWIENADGIIAEVSRGLADLFLVAGHYPNFQNSIISFDYSWFLGKNISNFVSLPWKLNNWYCHIIHPINLGTYQCSNIRGLGNVVIYNLFISSLANMSTLSENCPSSKAIQSFSSFSSRTYWHSTLPVQIFRWPKNTRV